MHCPYIDKSFYLAGICRVWVHGPYTDERFYLLADIHGRKAELNWRNSVSRHDKQLTFAMAVENDRQKLQGNPI